MNSFAKTFCSTPMIPKIDPGTPDLSICNCRVCEGFESFFLSNTKSTYCLSSMHVFQEHNQAFEESSCYAQKVQIFLQDN